MHRHPRKIDLLMARTPCLVCLISTVCGCCKNALEEAALVAGTSQNLSNLLFSDIYEQMAAATTTNKSILSFENICNWQQLPAKLGGLLKINIYKFHFWVFLQHSNLERKGGGGVRGEPSLVRTTLVRNDTSSTVCTS
jgi:hypothetical protein